jgi:hypothetical protein
MHILATLEPLDPVSGTRSLLRVASKQDRNLTGMGGHRWWPAITKKPSLSMRLFEGDFSDAIDPGQGSIELQLPPLVKLDVNARRFVWAGTPITLYAANDGASWPWPLAIKARVKSFRTEGDKLSLTFEVDSEPFQVKLPSALYAGTTGIEGGSDLKNKPKPMCFGAPRNVEPILINSVDNVYQFHAGGPIRAIETLYERGSAFPASIGDAANYNDLVASTIPNGKYATCLALGLIRLGAPAYGVITADVRGDNTGGIWARKPGAIIKRMFALAGISSDLYDATSLDDMDAVVGAYAGGGNISIVLTNQADVIDIARDIARGCNFQCGVSFSGQLFVTRPSLSSPTLTLDAQGRRLPMVSGTAEVEVSPPYKRLQMSGARSWRVHSFDEIAFSATLVDRGGFSTSATYREGNIVTLPNGSRWLFVSTTPLVSSIPSDTNANWARMSDDLTAANIVYDDGTPVEVLKPSAPGATNSADPGSPFGDKTVGSVIADLDQVHADLNIVPANIFDLVKLAGTLNTLLQAMTTLNGLSIGTVVTQLQEVAESAVENLSLIGARNAAGTAFNLALDTVSVDGDTTLARRLSQLEAYSDSGLSVLNQSLQEVILTGDKALSTRQDTVEASLNGANGLKARVSFLISALVETGGTVLAKAVLVLNANNRVAGIRATNTGVETTLDLEFDRTRIFRSDGTLLLRAGSVAAGEDPNEVYAPRLVVDTLAVNTAVVPVRAAATAGINGTNTARVSRMSMTIVLKRPGWIEVTSTVKQGFQGSLTDVPWSAAIAVDGVELPESLVAGSVPGDSLALSGAILKSAGTYTIELMWNAHNSIRLEQRSMFAKGFNATS